MKEIEIQGIPHTIRSNSRALRVVIRIDETGQVIVTKPARLSIEGVSKLLKEKIGWTQDMVTAQKAKPQKLLARYSIKDFKENKEKARILAHERLTYFNQFYGFTIKKIFIRNQKSRWGSCSGKGNLNFNYKIALLPKELADYVIVHELCHLKEMNHSERFWNLVGQQIPEYEQKKKKIQLF